MKLIYKDEYEGNILIGEILGGDNLTVEAALELLDVDMNDWAAEQGWDGFDYNDIEMVY